DLDNHAYGSFDLWVSHRASEDAPWGPPKNLEGTINGSGRDFSPVFSRDGHFMIYAHGGASENGDDLYLSYREHTNNDFAWQTPKPLGPNVNSSLGDSGPALFEDKKTGAVTLYFTSNRVGGGPSDWDVYASTLPAGFTLLDVYNGNCTFGPAKLVPEVSSPY